MFDILPTELKSLAVRTKVKYVRGRVSSPFGFTAHLRLHTLTSGCRKLTPCPLVWG